LVLSRVMIATGATEFVASESDILDGIAWGLMAPPELLPEQDDESAEVVLDEMTQELDED